MFGNVVGDAEVRADGQRSCVRRRCDHHQQQCDSDPESAHHGLLMSGTSEDTIDTHGQEVPLGLRMSQWGEGPASGRELEARLPEAIGVPLEAAPGRS